MSFLRSLVSKVVAIVLLVILSPVLFACAVLIRVTSRGPVFHRSVRIGQNGATFTMLKFRTMKADTPQLATHLLPDPASRLTPVGGLMRKYSLDELPQLIHVVRGEMQFIGPRPALYNQDDLMALRDTWGVTAEKPGITGWAQVNGRDLLSLEDKVGLETFYASNQSAALNTQILFRTVAKLKPEEVSH